MKRIIPFLPFIIFAIVFCISVSLFANQEPQNLTQEIKTFEIPKSVLISNIDPLTNFITCEVYAEIPERTKAKLYDIAINTGNSRANKILQQSINEISNKGLVVDGKIGPGTLNALCGLNEQRLLEMIAQKQLEFYKGIVERDPSQERFLKGWSNRSFWIPDTSYNYKEEVPED